MNANTQPSPLREREMMEYKRMRSEGIAPGPALWNIRHRRAVERAETDDVVRFVWDYDPDYEVTHPCDDYKGMCHDPDNHDLYQKYYDEEVENLNMGVWDALCVVVERRVTTGGGYLPLVSTWEFVDSLYGIVVADSRDRWFIENEMLPTDLYERYK